MDKLKNFLDKSKIKYSLDKEVIRKNSEDTSLFKITPEIVIYPKNKYEVSEIARFVFLNKGYNIASRSAGSDMSGGVLGSSIVLSFTKYFNNIIAIDKEKKEAIVEPGVYYRDFEKETLKSSLILPTYPASREMCALGGMVANNSGGEKSLIYGKTEDYILEIECVLANGEIVNLKEEKLADFESKLINASSEFRETLEYKISKEILDIVKDENNINTFIKNKPIVSKNSAGYYLWNILKEKNGEKYINLANVIVGSQGTLGIITNIRLRLIEDEKYTKMLVIFVKNLSDLKDITRTLIKYNPGSLESYDNHTFKVAIKFLPSFIKNIYLKNQENKWDLIKLAFSFWKELRLLLFFGMPKIFLLAEFAGDKEEELIKRVANAEKDLNSNVKNIKTEFVKTDIEMRKYWTMRRESFNLLRQKIKNLRTAPFIDDVIVPREELGSFLDELIPILNKYNLLYTIAGHVGEGNLHIIPLMDFSTEDNIKKDLSIIEIASHEVYGLINKYHGSITGEHNDGLIRTPFLHYMYDNDMLSLFKRVKFIFDEKNILNPGKKVPINDNPELEFKNNLTHVKFR